MSNSYSQMTDPVRIDPCGCYTRPMIEETICRPLGIDVDGFLSRLKPRKVFRCAWLGADLLEAWRSAPALSEKQEKPRGKNRGNRGRRNLSPTGENLIGGIFSRKEVGLPEYAEDKQS